MANLIDKYLRSKGFDVQWLVDQRIKHKLTYEQIAVWLDVSLNTVRRLCNEAGIEPVINMPARYSNDQLLAALSEGYSSLGYLNYSRYDAWATQNQQPRACTIADRFGDFNAALRLIGRVSEIDNYTWSDEQIKHQLSILCEELGCTPTKDEINNRCPFTTAVLDSRYGGIYKSLEKFGLNAIKNILCIDCDAIVAVSKYNGSSRKRCTKCQNAKRLAELDAWSAANPERVAAQRLEYYYKNKVEMSVKHKEWYRQLKIKYGINDVKPKVVQNIMANFISEMYPSCSIIQEKTWPWLVNPATGRHLFIDIYIPEMAMAVEYHGEYHYVVRPPYTKTQAELETRQHRDKIKAELCKNNGIRYYSIPWTVGLSKTAVYNILHAVYVKRGVMTEKYGVPRNHCHGDIGYDLRSVSDIIIGPNQRVMIDTGIYIDMPYDIYASILLRSSMAQKGLMTYQSLIDPGYRGELKITVWNWNNDSISIKSGERVGQILFAHKAFVSLIQSDELCGSIRGANGYGSTGS